MLQNTDVICVEKDQIKFLRFPKKDVLDKRKDQIDRFLELQRVLSPDSPEHQKVKIVFIDDQGPKKVETTIWGISDKEVILKQANIIPLKRIISIS